MVILEFGYELSYKPEIESPQYFCEHARISDIIAPTNIVWYAGGDPENDTVPLPATHLLQDGYSYYAAILVGEECFSPARTKVDIILGRSDYESSTPEQMTLCSGIMVADLPANGFGITWFSDELLENEVPLDALVVDGETYYAASASGDCALMIAAIEVTLKRCNLRLYGTVFPFVYDTLSNGTSVDTFNSLYVVTARLYPVPPVVPGFDPIKLLARSKPLHETKAIYYDGFTFVKTTPLHPGVIGSPNNPGFPIDWELLNIEQGEINHKTVIEGDSIHPSSPVGLYTFENVEEGDYILYLSAPGLVTRYGQIRVASDTSLGHRELVVGDFNCDGIVDQKDATHVNAKLAQYPDPQYLMMFDVNKDGKVDKEDVRIVAHCTYGFTLIIYKETRIWLFQFIGE
jgi:hypothetical protein